MPPTHLLKAVLAQFVLLQAVGAGVGSAACPCLTNVSDTWLAISTEATTLGYPVEYGLGCAAHDINNTKTGCSEQTLEAHCFSHWCYVDETLCPVDVEKCRATGARVGSDDSPHCRERPSNPSHIVTNVSAYYSYQTCGSLNAYDVSAVMEPVAGSIIKIAVDAWPPLVVKKRSNPATPHVDVYGGLVYDFFIGLANSFSPKPSFEIVPGWATEQSRALFPYSSYTACVHDVAVGNFDACIADLWLTPERAQMSAFLPTLTSAYFYLVVPLKIEESSVWTRLQQPFKPFSPLAWMAIAAFLIFLSLLIWLVDTCEGGFDKFREKTCKMHAKIIMTALFRAFHDFFSAKASPPGGSAAHRAILFGFSVFLLVTASSYTANLASIFVVQKQAVGTIKDIEDAGNRGIKVCSPGVIVPALSAMHPGIEFVDDEWQEAGPRRLYAGTCGAVVLSELVVANLHAGDLQRSDCESVADGTLSEEEGRCTIGLNGRKRNDCELMQVGGLLTSIPIAMPVSSRLDKSLSWASIQQIAQGRLAEQAKLNEQYYPQSKCGLLGQDEEKEFGLPLDDVVGAMYISAIFFGVGLLVILVKAAPKKLLGGKHKEVAGQNEDSL